jgi:ATP-dependent DNA helicase RecQ
LTGKTDILKKYWGYDAFRPGQEAIIDSVLDKKDTLALMPTGGGKSITYQVPAMMMDGICIVVSPLIALMKDQVNRLLHQKIKALAIFSGMTRHEIEVTLDNAQYGGFKFLYVSPERLESENFKERLKNMPVGLVAVDEAHCISQWGYDFRPSYLNIAKVRELHPQAVILALTASATPEVANDIQEKLLFPEKNVIKSGFARENLILAVRDHEDKLSFILNTLKKIGGTGIIYARNRKNTKELATLLMKNGISADYYHAGLKHEVRHLKQQDWTTGKTRIICATNAFGMGIDKADVRFVIHFDLPDSLEEYYQEAGRAGRDGKKAYAVLLANATDELKARQRVKTNFPDAAHIKRVYNAVCNFYQLPVGSGKGNVFDFNLADFCSIYKLQVLVAYNSLKILEREGYIELTDDVNNPSRVFFIVNRDDLYKYQVANQHIDGFIKLLLRSYTGLFSNYVPIDETMLARKANLKPNDVYQYLVILSKQKIINYIPQKKTPLLIFTEERLDEKTLVISPENLRTRKERFEKRLEKVLHYALDESSCRNEMMLAYFGEQLGKRCGKCDNCRKEAIKGVTLFEFDSISEILFEHLKNEKMKTEHINAISPYSAEKNTAVIRQLLDLEKLTYDPDYYLVIKGQ